MIFNTTYFDEETRDAIIKLVGKSFGIREIFRLGTVGSSRMRVSSCSQDFLKFVQHNNDTVYASIALRPKGILVTVSRNHQNLSWAIPYHLLSIYKTDVLSLHASGQFLKLDIKKDQNRKFIRKVLNEKVLYLENPTLH